MKYNIFLEIITCDPSINTMHHPDLIECRFMGNSIGLKRIKYLVKLFTGKLPVLYWKNIKQYLDFEEFFDNAT